MVAVVEMDTVPDGWLGRMKFGSVRADECGSTPAQVVFYVEP